MPNTRSASKRLKQDKALHVSNRAVKSSFKTQIKKVVAALDSGEFATAEQEYILAAKKLDKAGAKGIIHLNKAARLKSRLHNRIKKAKASAA